MKKDDTRRTRELSGEHVEPLFAALASTRRSGSSRWKIVWVVLALAALTLLVWKQAF